MGWLDETDKRDRRISDEAKRKRQKLREAGYQDIDVTALDLTFGVPREVPYRYEFVAPGVDPEEFRENVAHLLADFREPRATVDAPRQGCAAGPEAPSLSRVKQLNRDIRPREGKWRKKYGSRGD